MCCHYTHGHLALVSLKKLYKLVSEIPRYRGEDRREAVGAIVLGSIIPDIVFLRSGIEAGYPLTHWILEEQNPIYENLNRFRPFATEFLNHSRETNGERGMHLALGYISHIITDQFSHPLLPHDRMEYRTLCAALDAHFTDGMEEIVAHSTFRKSDIDLLGYAFLLEPADRYMHLSRNTSLRLAEMQAHLGEGTIRELKDSIRDFPRFIIQETSKSNDALHSLSASLWNEQTVRTYVYSNAVRSVLDRSVAANVQFIASLLVPSP